MQHTLSYNEYLRRNIFSRRERAGILIMTARTFYNCYAEAHNLKVTEFVNLPIAEKEIWVVAARAAIRSLFGMEGDSPADEVDADGNVVD